MLPKDVIIFNTLSGQYKKFNQLQEEIGFSKSTLSDAIKRYQEKGLIKKTTCPKDKRNLYLSLTEEGEEMFKKITIIDEEYVEFIKEKINCEDFLNFQKILNEIVS